MADPPILVDPEVTRRKVERELDLWAESEEIYRRRGWILLGHRDLEVDVGFLARLPIGAQQLPALAACTRLDFTNFDLWPPSLEFIDPFSGTFMPPAVQALVDSDEGPRDLLVQSHPDTNRPFFCVPASGSITSIPSTPVIRGLSTEPLEKEAWRQSVIGSGGRWHAACSASMSRSRHCRGECSSNYAWQAPQARLRHCSGRKQNRQRLRGRTRALRRLNQVLALPPAGCFCRRLGRLHVDTCWGSGIRCSSWTDR